MAERKRKQKKGFSALAVRIGLVCVCIYLCVSLVFAQIDIVSKRQQLENLTQQVAAQEAANTELQRTLDSGDEAAYMERIARDVAAETGCSLHVGRSDGYRAVTNDAALLDAVRPAVPELREAPATYITEDFSAYQRRVPGVFFLLGTGGEALHSPQFTFDESVLLTGAALLRRLAVLGDAV